jgi:hypothetical protein
MSEPESDPRQAFVYTEAVRGLTQQQTLVEGINGRVGSLIFAAALRTRFSATERFPMGWECSIGLP